MMQNIGKNRFSSIIPLRPAVWREKKLLSIEGASDMGFDSFLSKFGGR